MYSRESRLASWESMITPSRPSSRVGHVTGQPPSIAPGQGPRWRHGLGAIEVKRKDVLLR